MKKTYALSHPKIKRERLFDSIKHDIKKFQSRERKAALPSGASYWDFECKFGYSEETAASIHPGELKALLNTAAESDAESLYIEMKSKAVFVDAPSDS